MSPNVCALVGILYFYILLDKVDVSMILVLDTNNPGFSEAEEMLTPEATESAIDSLLAAEPVENVRFKAFNFGNLLMITIFRLFFN